MKHAARVQIIGWQDVKGISSPVPIWSPACELCGGPVRQMFGLRRPGVMGPIFYHASGKAQPGDARLGERRPEHSAAISKGMRAANARRKASRS